jgi:FtsH-binding integral membrane protein
MFCSAWWVSIKFSTFNQGCATTFMRSPLTTIAVFAQSDQDLNKGAKIFWFQNFYFLKSILLKCVVGTNAQKNVPSAK